MPVAIVPDAKPPTPLVTSHSRDSAARKLPQISRPNCTWDWVSMGDEGCCGATDFLFFGAAFATNGRSVFIGLEPFCHQETRVIVVTCAAIKLRSRIVALIDFEMDGVHSQFASA